MYAKVINPKTNGRKVYNNAGSSRRCASYLEKEAKEGVEEAKFFGAPGSEPPVRSPRRRPRWWPCSTAT